MDSTGHRNTRVEDGVELPRFGGRFLGSDQSFMSILLASNSMGER